MEFPPKTWKVEKSIHFYSFLKYFLNVSSLCHFLSPINAGQAMIQKVTIPKIIGTRNFNPPPRSASPARSAAVDLPPHRCSKIEFFQKFKITEFVIHSNFDPRLFINIQSAAAERNINSPGQGASLISIFQQIPMHRRPGQ